MAAPIHAGQCGRCDRWDGGAGTSGTSTSARAALAVSVALSVAGSVAVGDQISICKLDGTIEKTKVTKMYAFEGLKQKPIDRAEAGEIVVLAGIEDIYIGETVSAAVGGVTVRLK